MEKTTLGVIIGNRGVFPGNLASEGREEIVNLLKKEGIDTVIIPSEETKYGAIARNMTAYVVEIQDNTLIIDEWSSTDTDKPIPEGSIKWE